MHEALAATMNVGEGRLGLAQCLSGRERGIQVRHDGGIQLLGAVGGLVKTSRQVSRLSW